MTIPVTTSKGAFSFISCAKETQDFDLDGNYLNLYSHDNLTQIEVPPGSTLIGIYPDMDEQAAKQIHESQPPHTTTSLALMPLLMMANRIYLVNPYGEKPKNYLPSVREGFVTDNYRREKKEFEEQLKKWQEAEQRRSNKWAVIQH